VGTQKDRLKGGREQGGRAVLNRAVGWGRGRISVTILKKKEIKKTSEVEGAIRDLTQTNSEEDQTLEESCVKGKGENKGKESVNDPPAKGADSR